MQGTYGIGGLCRAKGTYGVVVRFSMSRAADDGGECWVSIAKVGESL